MPLELLETQWLFEVILVLLFCVFVVNRDYSTSDFIFTFNSDNPQYCHRFNLLHNGVISGVRSLMLNTQLRSSGVTPTISEGSRTIEILDIDCKYLFYM